MDLNPFIRDIEDFINKRIHINFFKYKITCIKKQIGDKKKASNSRLNYNKVLNSVIDLINQIEHNTGETVIESENLSGILKRIKLIHSHISPLSRTEDDLNEDIVEKIFSNSNRVIPVKPEEQTLNIGKEAYNKTNSYGNNIFTQKENTPYEEPTVQTTQSPSPSIIKSPPKTRFNIAKVLPDVKNLHIKAQQTEPGKKTVELKSMEEKKPFIEIRTNHHYEERKKTNELDKELSDTGQINKNIIKTEKSKTGNHIKEEEKVKHFIQSKYYTPPIIRQIKKTAPIDSPLYNLLISYEDFKSYKIELKDWIEKIFEGAEELNCLSGKIKRYEKRETSEIISLEKSINLTLSIIKELKATSEELEYNRHISRPREREEIKELLNELEEYNNRIYEDLKTLPSEETDMEMSLKTWEEEMKTLPEAMYRTPNYIKLENIAFDFMRKVVSKEKYINFLITMKDLINQSREKYNFLQVMEHEVTLEVYRGSKFMCQALDIWDEGIIFLKNYINTQDENDIYDGLSLIYEGNKKLVFIQYFTRQIEKQAQIQNFQRDLSMGKKHV